MSTMIRVPPSVLSTRRSVHVDNGVDPMLGARSNCSIEVLEAVRSEDPRFHVIFKMTIVHCDANAVQTERFEEGCIGFCEEMFQELVYSSTSISHLNAMIQNGILTLSKKNSDFFSPSTSARASRIWNSHPGYPESGESTRRQHTLNQLAIRAYR